MAICAIVRVAGFQYKGLVDATWGFFWQHAEGAIAVMMASITAFRTVFVKPTYNTEATTPLSPVESLFHRFFNRFQTLARAQPGEKPTSNPDPSPLKLPEMPSPIFTGMRTFIRRNNRQDVSAATFVSLDSAIDNYETHYHSVFEIQKRAASNSIHSHV